MNAKDLECLASWLRCYPVEGRESERKRLTEVVETELAELRDDLARDRRKHRLVICDGVSKPHSLELCKCTEGHKNPRWADTVFIPEWGPSNG